MKPKWSPRTKGCHASTRYNNSIICRRKNHCGGHLFFKVKELIVNKEPNLLDSFLDVSWCDVPPSLPGPPCAHAVRWVCVCVCVCHTQMQEVIAFQADTSPDVRKFVVTFMEEAW